ARVAVLAEDPLHPTLPLLGYRTDLVVAGAVEPSLAMLVDRVRRALPPGARADRLEGWRARHEPAREAARAAARRAGAGAVVEPRWVAHELDALLPAGAVVVDETITHRLDLLRGLERLGPGQLVEASHGGLGTGLGAALGVKAAAPERTVVATIGDGAFHYNPVTAALGAAQEHGLPILVVLFANGGYLSQQAAVPRLYPEGWAVRANRFAGTAIAPDPDYAALVRAFGGYGERVETPAAGGPALRRGL